MFGFFTNKVEYISQRIDEYVEKLINLSHHERSDVRQTATAELRTQALLILSSLENSTRLEIMQHEVRNYTDMLNNGRQADAYRFVAESFTNLVSALQCSLKKEMQENKDIQVRLTCYTYITSILNGTVKEQDIIKLIEDTAVELRRLYNRTKNIGHYENVCVGQRTYFECGSGGSSLCPFYDYIYEDQFIVDSEVPDPDYDSIKTLVSEIPSALIDRIKYISGELKDKTDIWPNNG